MSLEILDEEKTKSENNINLIKSNIEQKINIYVENYYKYFFLLFSTIVFFITGYGFIYCVIKKYDIIGQFALILAFIVNIMIFAIIVKYNASKIELIKDLENNLLKIKKYNLLCCEKIVIYFTLENVFIDLIVDKGNENNYYHLLIINIFKNKSEIDFEKSNVTHIPAKIFYLIKNIKYQNILKKESLNNFVGTSPDTENPIIENLSGIPLSNTTFDYKIKQFMKISEHFFFFYYKGPLIEDILLYMFLVLINLSFLLGVFIFSVEVNKKVGIILGIIIFIVLIIFNYYIIYKRSNRTKRMDVIYSNDFKRMFIGLVKYNEKSYKKTFIFETELIERFILQEYKKSKKIFTIKIMLKDKGLQDICNIEDTKSNLLNLLDKLNEKFENKKE